MFEQQIYLDKIDTADKDRLYYNKLREHFSSEIKLPPVDDIINSRQSCGYYEDLQLLPFGVFFITLGRDNVGSIELSAKKNGDFNSNGLVDIEFSYDLFEEYRGRGIMTYAIKNALDYIKQIKETYSNIMFFGYKGAHAPENREILHAKSIGEIFAKISDIGNYPSLSSAVKAGGEVSSISSGDIKVTFSNLSNEHSNVNFTKHVMNCSKKLCTLGFNQFDEKFNPNMTDDNQDKAKGAFDELLLQAIDLEIQKEIKSIAKDLLKYGYEESEKIQDYSVAADDSERTIETPTLAKLLGTMSLGESSVETDFC